MTLQNVTPQPRNWQCVRLSTIDFVLDTHLPISYSLSTLSEQHQGPLPYLCLPETTIRHRHAQNQNALIVLTHCVIARTQIVYAEPWTDIAIDTDLDDLIRTRQLAHFEKDPVPLPQDLTIPHDVSAHEFRVRSVRVLTDHLILDAQIGIYVQWTSLSADEWLHHDQRALITFSSIHLKPRIPKSYNRNASLLLTGCELWRHNIVHVSEPIDSSDTDPTPSAS